MIHQQPSDRKSAALLDSYGRTITYLRVSVTDRCDLRCTYCMSESMQFLPKTDVLSLEELDRLCGTFIDLGVEKIRLTGGEPLVRRDIMKLVERLSERVRSGALKELTLTTNGTQLKRFAWDLADLGIQRINVSLDTKDRETFKRITRRDALDQVLDGIAEAQKAGIKIKINTVALRQDNEQEIPELIKWAHGQGHDLTLIETMPLGDVEGDRTEQFVSLAKLRHEMESYWTLTERPDQTGGPARYVDIKETGGRLGFITPLSHNFCSSCNRIRVTCTGTLFTCLGHEQAVQLRDPLRAPDGDVALPAAIKDALAAKPKAHSFLEETLSTPSVRRHMSLTGG